MPWHQMHDTMIMAHVIDPLGSGAVWGYSPYSGDEIVPAVTSAIMVPPNLRSPLFQSAICWMM